MNKQQKAKGLPRGGAGKIFTGEVVSNRTPKTVIVAVTSMHRHPIYKKAVRRTRRFPVHNESVQCAIGDTVRIQETKPISKTKHFIVLEKVA
jgi:small subunit ribosomal protein S17